MIIRLQRYSRILFFPFDVFRTTIPTTTVATTAVQPTTTLRPKRTTSALPTSANPLLRFYPPDELDDEEADPLEEQFMDDMLNDAALYHNTDGTTNKRDAHGGIMSPWASKSAKISPTSFIILSLSSFIVLLRGRLS